mgnify:FL=1|tara:strand:+ start:12 stop:284 length:273 start_codon:yes stop_codon:yes gene_type:complete
MALSQDEKRTRKRITAKGYLGATVTTNDSSNLDSERAELYIGTGGNVKVDLSGGSTVILKNVPSGTFLKGIYVDRVYRTSTTARDIVAIY